MQDCSNDEDRCEDKDDSKDVDKALRETRKDADKCNEKCVEDPEFRARVIAAMKKATIAAMRN